MQSRKSVKDTGNEREGMKRSRNSLVRSAVLAGALLGSTIMGCGAAQRPDPCPPQKVQYTELKRTTKGKMDKATAAAYLKAKTIERDAENEEKDKSIREKLDDMKKLLEQMGMTVKELTETLARSERELVGAEPDEEIITVTYIKERKTVREGDYLYKLQFPFQDGFEAMKVTKIDAKGIEFDLEMEVAATAHEGPPLRVNYGEKKRFGEFILNITIKAEKRTGKKSAIVEVRYPEIPPQKEDLEPLGKVPYHYGDAEHKKAQ